MKLAWLRSLLFPDPPRDFRGRRTVKISLRAVHVLCAGVLVGAWLLEAGSADRHVWLLATIGSGFALLALDLHETAAFLAQVRGLFVLGKMTVVALLPVLGPSAGLVLAAFLLLSVVLSHAPSGVRYFVVLGRGSVRGACSKG